MSPGTSEVEWAGGFRRRAMTCLGSGVVQTPWGSSDDVVRRQRGVDSEEVSRGSAVA